MNKSLVDLMTKLDGCGVESAWKKSVDYLEGFGFHIVNYGIIDKMHGDMLGFHSNMPDDWMARYMEREYSKDDPWAQHVISNKQPIYYHRVGPSELSVPQGSTAEKMINETSDFDLNSSICVPIHNSLGHLITGVNLGSKLKHAEFKAMLDEKLEDILLSVAVMNNQLIETPILETKLPSWYTNPYYKQLLSERELEVLKWLSEGHRNDRIAERMNIASVTVNFHLKEIKRKLGAQTREQSIALAFRKGLLR